jgi:hypothetical protein
MFLINYKYEGGMKSYIFILLITCFLIIPGIIGGQTINKDNLSFELLQQVFTDSLIHCSIDTDEVFQPYLNFDSTHVVIYLGTLKNSIQFFSFLSYDTEADENTLNEYIDTINEKLTPMECYLDDTGNSIDLQDNLKVNYGISYKELIKKYWWFVDETTLARMLDKDNILKN